MYSPIPIKRSSKFGNNYWEAYSPKAHRNVCLFSDLEYDHWILIETNPQVRSFCERPLEIKEYDEDKEKNVKTMFDMWIKWNDDSEEFVKVQYSNKKTGLNAGKTRAQQLWCKKHGVKYEVKTEKDIRNNVLLLSNMKMILPYISNRSCPIETDLYKIKHCIGINKKHSIAEIESQLDIDSGRIREAIYWFLYQGQLQSNANAVPIGPGLEVWVND